MDRPQYDTLYKSADSILVNVNLEVLVFPNYIIPKIDKNPTKGPQKEIEEGEVLNVLKHMKNDKSPLNDGGYVAKF